MVYLHLPCIFQFLEGIELVEREPDVTQRDGAGRGLRFSVSKLVSEIRSLSSKKKKKYNEKNPKYSEY